MQDDMGVGRAGWCSLEGASSGDHSLGPGAASSGDHSLGPGAAPLQAQQEWDQHVFQRLQPITTFCPVPDIERDMTRRGLVAPLHHITSNSAVIEILAHLLCRAREQDPARRELLFGAISKIIEQWNSSLYLPLHTFSQLQGFRTKLIDKFEGLFEKTLAHSGKAVSLPLSSLNIPNALADLHFIRPNVFPLRDDRYGTEFEEEEVLGRGGFGVVTKVRNRLDGHHYAVKIIPMKRSGSMSQSLLVREVQSLAQLEHPNIVRYHSAWLQWYSRPPAHPRASPHATPAQITELSSTSESNEVSEDSDGIVFEERTHMSNSRLTDLKRSHQSDLKKFGNASSEINSSYSNYFQNYRREIQFQQNAVSKESINNQSMNGQKFWRNPASTSDIDNSAFQPDLSLDDEDENVMSRTSVSEESNVTDNKPLMLYRPTTRQLVRRQRLPRLTLFIQMGLCQESLQDWLVHRNGSIVKGGEPVVDQHVCLDIFRQILQAVDFIHSHSIVHRDIKPANIFFTKSGKQIKIGDFGLARKLEQDNPATPSDMGSESSVWTVPNSPHTRGVGTPIYAAPELKAGGHYGVESDMHNIGIVLLELFQPFQTGSERIHSIENLKTNRKLNEDFIKCWPNIVPWILRLTEREPKRRPSATQVLDGMLRSTTTGPLFTREKLNPKFSVKKEITFITDSDVANYSKEQTQRNVPYYERQFGNLSLNDNFLEVTTSSFSSTNQNEQSPRDDNYDNPPIDLENIQIPTEDQPSKDDIIAHLQGQNKRLREQNHELCEQVARLEKHIALLKSGTYIEHES